MINNENKTPILYLDNSYTFGGAINSLSYLVRAINKDVYDPIVVTGQPEDFLEKHFSDITYYHVKLKLPWVHDSIYKKLISFSLFKKRLPLRLINVLRSIFWTTFIAMQETYKYYLIGRKHRVKLVHLNNILGSQLAGILSAKLLGVPCVAHLRDFEIKSASTEFFAKLIDHHIAISSSIKDNLLELGVNPERISIIHDAIDLDEFNDAVDLEYLKTEFHIEQGQKTFGVFGRIVEWKGIKEFVSAAAEVIKEVPQALAFIVGNPSDGKEEYYKDIKNMVNSLRIEKNIIFTGYRNDVPALMKLMDVIVHSSIKPEPFGMVIIEGMAMQKPIVATNGGGPLDIVLEGETGYLVKMGDSDEMAKSIIYLLRNDLQSSQMGKRGRDRVEINFCKERYARQVENIYEQMT